MYSKNICAIALSFSCFGLFGASGAYAINGSASEYTAVFNNGTIASISKNMKNKGQTEYYTHYSDKNEPSVYAVGGVRFDRPGFGLWNDVNLVGKCFAEVKIPGVWRTTYTNPIPIPGMPIFRYQQIQWGKMLDAQSVKDGMQHLKDGLDSLYSLVKNNICVRLDRGNNNKICAQVDRGYNYKDGIMRLVEDIKFMREELNRGDLGISAAEKKSLLTILDDIQYGVKKGYSVQKIGGLAQIQDRLNEEHDGKTYIPGAIDVTKYSNNYFECGYLSYNGEKRLFPNIPQYSTTNLKKCLKLETYDLAQKCIEDENQKFHFLLQQNFCLKCTDSKGVDHCKEFENILENPKSMYDSLQKSSAGKSGDNQGNDASQQSSESNNVDNKDTDDDAQRKDKAKVANNSTNPEGAESGSGGHQGKDSQKDSESKDGSTSQESSAGKSGDNQSNGTSQEGAESKSKENSNNADSNGTNSPSAFTELIPSATIKGQYKNMVFGLGLSNIYKTLSCAVVLSDENQIEVGFEYTYGAGKTGDIDMELRRATITTARMFDLSDEFKIGAKVNFGNSRVSAGNHTENCFSFGSSLMFAYNMNQNLSFTFEVGYKHIHGNIGLKDQHIVIQQAKPAHIDFGVKFVF